MTENLSFAISVAATLRGHGVTQLYTEQKKFKARMSYADKLKVPFAVIIGEDEAVDGVVSVKNMRTGEQVKLPPLAAAELIRAALPK